MSSMGYLRRQKADLDRLSGLPEEVLGRILSFLPFQQAVSTSILSRPWRYVWRLVPDLEFHDSCLNRARFDPNRVWWFLMSVNRALSFRETPIRRFSLQCQHPCHSACLSGWIAAAVRFGVREVNLHLNLEYLERVPTSLFTCETLTQLVLRGGIEIDLANKAISLPNVKNLRLDRVRFTSLGSIERILHACPILEDLDICRRSDDEELIVNIIVPTLKILSYTFHKLFPQVSSLSSESEDSEEENEEGEVRADGDNGNHNDNDYDDEQEEEELKYKLIISAPNLEDLHLNDKVTDKYIVKDGIWTWLDDAYVNVHGEACALGLVEAISNAKSIALSGGTLRSLSDENVLPTFHNLNKLELGISDSCLEFVNEFLEKSPSLELLIFEKERRNFRYQRSFWIAPLSVPRCLLMSLKEIIFEDFFGYEYEVDLLEYLLQNGRALRDVTVRCQKYVTFDVRNMIDEFPRRCQLYFMH